MADQEIAFHYHTYGVSTADYEASASLKSFFKVISSDHSVRGEKFPTALESYDHSIFALLYHPEY
jgi:hypothetical protein